MLEEYANLTMTCARKKGLDHNLGNMLLGRCGWDFPCVSQLFVIDLATICFN